MIIGPQHGVPLPASLSASQDKLDLYATDTYFRESWEDLIEVAGSDEQAEAALDPIAAITFKPDAVAGRAIRPSLEWLDERGYIPVAAELFVFDRHTIRTMWLYTLNVATRDRKDVIDELLRLSPSLLVLLRGPADASIPAARLLSKTKGPACPLHRRPGQLRYGLGRYSTLLNFVHTADEPADVVRELGVVFPAVKRRDLYARALRAQPFAELGAMVDDLEAHYPAYDLSLARTTAALRRRLEALEPDRVEPLALLLDEVDSGVTRDWRRVLGEIERSGIPCSDWERIVIATHLLQMEVPGGEVLVRGVSAPGESGPLAEAEAISP